MNPALVEALLLPPFNSEDGGSPEMGSGSRKFHQRWYNNVLYAENFFCSVNSHSDLALFPQQIRASSSLNIFVENGIPDSVVAVLDFLLLEVQQPSPRSACMRYRSAQDVDICGPLVDVGV
jgi:hypothetical protein